MSSSMTLAENVLNTEKFLAISHLIGAVLVWQLAVVDSYNELLLYAILYSLVYAPTLPLTNSLAFHHLADRDRARADRISLLIGY